MNHVRSLLAAALAVGLLVVTFGIATTRPLSGSQTASVIVVNAASQAVPVSDVDNPARHPISLRAAGLDGGSSSVGLSFGPTPAASPTYTVPAGQELVVDNLSLAATLPSGQRVTACGIEVNNVSGATRGAFAPSFSGTDTVGLDISVYNQPMRAYFDPGTSIFISCDRNGTTGQGNYDAQIQGHLVSLP
jgi:hypothetical protein